MIRKHITKNKKTLVLLGVESFEEVQAIFDIKIEAWNKKFPKNPITVKNMAIDHIKPVSKFNNSEEDIRQSNHYTNFQPLPQDVNSHKSAKWSDKDEEFWRANIIGNAEFCDIYLPSGMD